MEITTKIRKDLLLLECYARPNNPRQGVRRTGEGVIKFYNTYFQKIPHHKIFYTYRPLEPSPENLSFAKLNLIFYPPPWRGYEQDLFIFQLRFDNTRNLFLLIFQHYTDFFRQKLQDFLEVF